MGTTTSIFPSTPWDGSSPNRDPSDPILKAPNNDDWKRAVSEIQATQLLLLLALTGDDFVLPIHQPGTAAVDTTVEVIERGDVAVHKTVFNFTDFPITTTDPGAPAVRGTFGSRELYEFPIGRILFMSGHLSIPLGGLTAVTGGGAGFSDTADFDLGVGHAAAGNAVGFGLSGDEEIIVNSLDVNLVAGVSAAGGKSSKFIQHAEAGPVVPVKMYLNLRTLDNADHGPLPDVLLVNGVLTLVWSNMGDG